MGTSSMLGCLMKEVIIGIISGTNEMDSFTSWKRSQIWIRRNTNQQKKSFYHKLEKNNSVKIDTWWS